MKRISLYLDNDYIEYIDKIKKEKKCRSRNEALNIILDEHKNAHDVTVKNLYEFMAEKIADILKPQLNSLKHSSNKTNEEVQVITELMNGLYVHNKPQLNSLKHSSNKTNEEVQVITELMNGLYVHNQLPSLIPDSKSKPHGALTNSKANVKERILKQAYIKNNRAD